MVVLRPDFSLDGADHSRLFDFEVETTKLVAGDKSAGAKKTEVKQREKRYKTVVCRHWVKDLCMKMDDCEYLHELNPARMPECRWGEKCQVPDCIFKHTKEEDRVECTFYKIGFCRKGATCRFRHVRHAPEELPEEINWDDIGDGKVLKVTEIVSTEDGIEKKTIVQHNENYKVSICKHWKTTGECPFGARCHFAHGAHELRRRGADGDAGDEQKAPPRTDLHNIIEQYQAESRAAGCNPSPMEDVGEDLDTPDKELFMAGGEKGKPTYFVVRTDRMDHIAASLKHGCWSVLPCFMPLLNDAFERSAQVHVFFYSNDCNQFAGCAIMRSRVQIAVDVPFVDLPEDAKGHSFLFDVEWVYTCSLEFHKTAFLLYPEDELRLDIPVAMAFECAELPVPVGHALMVMMFRDEKVAIDVSQLGDVHLGVNMVGPDPTLFDPVDAHIEAMDEFIKENPSYFRKLRSQAAARGAARGRDALEEAQQILGPGGVPVAPGSMHVTKPGFVVASADKGYLREMLEGGLVGGPASRKSDMSVIQRGTLLVIYDLGAEMLHGIFEATGPAEEMLNPSAFRKHQGEDAVSELPIQANYRVALEVPPIPTQKIPTNLMLTDGSEAAGFVRIEPTHMQQLANLFARANPRNAAAAGGFGGDPMLHADFKPGISIRDMPPNKRGESQRCIAVNVPFPPEFKAAHRIIGKGGQNIKRIQDCGVRCTVKPLGVPGHSQDITGPFELVISGEDENMDNAERVVIEMSEDLIRKFEDFAGDRRPRHHRDMPPPPMRRGGPDFDDRRGPPPPHMRDRPPDRDFDRRGGGRGPPPPDRRGPPPDRNFDRRGGRGPPPEDMDFDRRGGRGPPPDDLDFDRRGGRGPPPDDMSSAPLLQTAIDGAAAADDIVAETDLPGDASLREATNWSWPSGPSVRGTRIAIRIRETPMAISGNASTSWPNLPKAQ
ncbi:30-kDa cleavage and polyadenylation specificity factor 30 (Protein OXIDATIVE STRESS TOLERANT 6) (Zinc finger CCCH domain-containing protein 11) (AtC3H11), partial [Durusdinium trenchii]